VKKTREFHDNESENISGESIGGAALTNFYVPDAALIRVNTVLVNEHDFSSLGLSLPLNTKIVNMLLNLRFKRKWFQ